MDVLVGIITSLLVPLLKDLVSRLAKTVLSSTVLSLGFLLVVATLSGLWYRYENGRLPSNYEHVRLIVRLTTNVVGAAYGVLVNLENRLRPDQTSGFAHHEHRRPSQFGETFSIGTPTPSESAGRRGYDSTLIFDLDDFRQAEARLFTRQRPTSVSSFQGRGRRVGTSDDKL